MNFNVVISLSPFRSLVRWKDTNLVRWKETNFLVRWKETTSLNFTSHHLDNCISISPLLLLIKLLDFPGCLLGKITNLLTDPHEC